MAARRASIRNHGWRGARPPSSNSPNLWWRVGELVAAAAFSIPAAIHLLPDFNRATVKSIIRETAEDQGLDPESVLRMAEIESALDPFAYHPVSRASGLFQFLPSTARQYGLNSVFNARANATAAGALWRDNAGVLRKGLGREPSAGEVYLAHQQGATGAMKLLLNPNRPAGDIVGYKAVTMNGGTEDMSARAFAALWIHRFQRD